MLTAAKEETFSAPMVWTNECVLPLAASGVYPKTRVWGSEPENLHCFSATSPLKIELRWGCEECSEKTAVGSGVSFKYDPSGRRIYKSSSSATSIYAYDGDNLIEETNSSGTVVARYSQTENIDEPLAMLRSSTTSYYQADGLGSVTSLSSTAGSLAQTYGYDSFGKQTSSSGSLINPFQYTAREFDLETSLYFYRARYFDPNVGRFLVEDPLRYHVGINFYVYASNNPIKFSDPRGTCPQGPDSVSNWHMGCEKSTPVQTSKQDKCACHCVYAPEAPPGQGCMDICMDCYSSSPTPYDACLCMSKRLVGRTKQQAESDCSSLKPHKWWWPW
jgi:RHS repeat-associated protein